MTAHTTRAHAKISPSAAHRWMNCPGSIRMIENAPTRQSSVFADEGTAAHMLAEACLSKGYRARHLCGRIIDINGKDFATQFLMPGAPLTDGRFEADTDMCEGVQLFLDTIAEHYRPEAGDVLRIEHRVNFSGDEEFGTADAVIYQPRLKRIIVFDLKYGAGVLVEVIDADGEPNPQLVCYGEGTVRDFMQHEIDALVICIVQPRMPHPDGPVREVSIGPLELLDWSFTIDAAVDATHDPNAPLVVGDWCKWCPANGGCPAYTARALAVAIEDFEEIPDDPNTVVLPQPELLSDAQVAKLLDGLDLFEAWARGVRAYAYARAEDGHRVPGYKLVDKDGRRQWTDQYEARKAMADLGLPVESQFAPPKLKSPAQIEKLVGKKDFAAKLAGYAPSISSGTTLVPSSNKRKEVTRSIEDHFDDLSD